MRKPIYHEKLKDIEIKPVELPEAEGPIPNTETSYPFNAAHRQQLPINLADYGYVEEEYIVSGYSNVYEYHDVGLYPKIRCENGHYCTRILVRRPANPDKQSGFALLEVFNYGGPCERAFATWGYCSEYILSRGDIWVGITIKQNAIDKLKRYDAKRYEKLGFPNPVPENKRRYGNTSVGGFTEGTPEDYENGLAYDAISQVAAMLKAKTRANPLCRNRFGKPARYVLAVGASGCDLSLYAAALQPFATTDGVHPCIDGFHIHMTGYPGFISNGETRFDADDDRCKIMTNVPLIWTQTMGDMRGGGGHPSYSYMYRWPDSDLPGRQHRQYEIAGAPMGTNYEWRCFPCMEDIAKVNGTEIGEQGPLDDTADTVPFYYVLRAALDHLRKWVKDGTPPPKSRYIEMQGEYPDADFVLDEHGNPKGGVRSPHLDVPTRTYTWSDDEPFTGRNIVTPFSPEKLKALYPTHDDYVRKVILSTLDMIRNGFLLPEDASKLIFDAMDAPIPE